MTAVSRLTAPKENRALLTEPPLETVSAIIEQNRDSLACNAAGILGRDFQDLRRLAKSCALQVAQQYFQEADEPRPPVHQDSLILAGHQPELFHPGVWVKNFVLNRLARGNDATPVNLIVDNDAVKSTSLALPQVSIPLPPISEFTPKLVFAAFDRWSQETAYEERNVQDESLFAAFPDNVATEWGFEPLLRNFWNEVLRQRQRTANLGERFVAARRTFERGWACHNLELPVSRLCGTEPYVWFFCHLLSELPRFHALYNQTIQSYRRRFRIRSRNHPVPELSADGDWLESPFWGWKSGDAPRGRLFARLRPDIIELRVANQLWPVLNRNASLVESARRLVGAETGYKIRSRALTNTLYARVFLGDLFIHGLGGGRYDELTDELIRGFYGLVAPEYLVVSATLRLPLPHYPATASDCRRLRRQLRDVHYNPQRHLPSKLMDETVQTLVQKKRSLIAQPYRTKRQRRQRFLQLKQVTDQLRSTLSQTEHELWSEWEECQRELQANAILQKRDYAFCLYPKELVRTFLMQFL